MVVRMIEYGHCNVAELVYGHLGTVRPMRQFSRALHGLSMPFTHVSTSCEGAFMSRGYVRFDDLPGNNRAAQRWSTARGRQLSWLPGLAAAYPFVRTSRISAIASSKGHHEHWETALAEF